MPELGRVKESSLFSERNADNGELGSPRHARAQERNRIEEGEWHVPVLRHRRTWEGLVDSCIARAVHLKQGGVESKCIPRAGAGGRKRPAMGTDDVLLSVCRVRELKRNDWRGAKGGKH